MCNQCSFLQGQVKSLEVKNEMLEARLTELTGDRTLHFEGLYLTKHESLVLHYLLATPGIASPNAIHAAIYDDPYSDSSPSIKLVDVWVCKLRKKLRPFEVDIINKYTEGYYIPTEHKVILRKLLPQKALAGAL